MKMKREIERIKFEKTKISILGHEIEVWEDSLGNLEDIAEASGETLEEYITRRICARWGFSEEDEPDQIYTVNNIIENEILNLSIEM
jgi:hypothetical protein